MSVQLKTFFDLQLIKSTDAEPTDMEGQANVRQWNNLSQSQPKHLLSWPAGGRMSLLKGKVVN
jgi:hypothetical protein